jgi:DNA-binding Xre family transcriptional regulator
MSIRRIKRYWKEGTYMKLRSPDTFKALMASRNVTVRELADLAKCSPAMIGHLRTGWKTEHSPDLAERIAGALRCRVEDLYEVSNDKDRAYFHQEIAA